MIVGRFEDGTPLTLQNDEGAHHPVMNNFTNPIAQAVHMRGGEYFFMPSLAFLGVSSRDLKRPSLAAGVPPSRRPPVEARHDSDLTRRHAAERRRRSIPSGDGLLDEPGEDEDLVLPW